ncbi:PIN domain-containing protein [Aquabacterium sp.]|uniref:PIN domain-containing protein n=1 Tax=Aquabacterium sp. TaxID=1872578 RepID=UPI003BF4EAEB
MAIQKLLFVDTNIWLDFYRARTEAGLALLEHLEKVSDKLIVHYQLEMEYKRNRQSAIIEGMQELKPPTHIPRPGLFSDAKAVKAMQGNLKAATDRVKSLKAKLRKVLADPVKHDPVYQACQRLFHAETNLILTRNDPFRHIIRRRAFRRFLHGCPPRKKNDTSIGDALNWEWMIECALRHEAELVIVSRDADYGAVFEDIAYINDHLKQEFSERVSRRRKILLYTKLSEALKHFQIPVTREEVEEEEAIIKAAPTIANTPKSKEQTQSVEEILRELDEFIKRGPPGVTKS